MVSFKLCKTVSDISPPCYTYGISIKDRKIVLSEVKDISTNKKLVKKLKRLCKKHKVSPLHLRDVVEDFLVK